MHKQGNDTNCNVINEAESTKKINQHCGTFVYQNQFKKKKKTWEIPATTDMFSVLLVLVFYLCSA